MVDKGEYLADDVLVIGNLVAPTPDAKVFDGDDDESVIDRQDVPTGPNTVSAIGAIPGEVRLPRPVRPRSPMPQRPRLSTRVSPIVPRARETAEAWPLPERSHQSMTVLVRQGGGGHRQSNCAVGQKAVDPGDFRS